MPRILRFVEGEIRGLHEAAYLLGAFALLSALLALVRDRLLASTFGAGTSLDIYYAAFRIPDVLFVSIASFVSVFVLIPVLTRQQTQQEKHALIGNVVLGFGIVMLAVSAILFFTLPALLSLLFPALVAEGDTLLTISRLLLIQPVLLGASGILASVTQVNGRYMLYAIAPLLYNIGIIIGIAVLYPLFGMQGIIWGVIFGALLHLFVQVPFALRHGYLRASSFTLDIVQLWRIVSVSLPRTIAISANHVALLALVAIAAGLGAGSVSVFNLAFNLQAAPLAIIGSSYSVAAFPTLARFFSAGEMEHFRAQVLTAARHIIFWSVPLLALVVVLRAHLVRVIYGAGAFDWTDTRLTAAALALFIISLTAQALTFLFVRGYYAAGKTRTPLIVNVVTAIGIVLGAWGFTWLFEHVPFWQYFIEALLRVEGLSGTVVLMLPLSFALFAILNVITFTILFARDFGSFEGRVQRTLFESFAAAVVAGFAAHEMLRILSEVFDIDTFVGVFSQGLISGIIGIAAAALVLVLLKNPEIEEVARTMHSKFWRRAPLFSSNTERGTDV